MAQYRTRRAPVDGVLLIDKPPDLTSHDVVARIRRQVRPLVKKVGHAGTLDPFATGLLVVLVGKATKIARFFVDLPKEYVCTMQFGVTSDTGDLTGDLAETGERTTRAVVEALLPRFIGTIQQRVPMTSAVKVDGERLYKKAHRGETVETPVKEVEISALDILDFDEAAQTMRCRIACSKGTYVRQLAKDIGDAAGAGGHLHDLSRTAIGDLRLENAQPLFAFEEAAAALDGPEAGIPGLLPPGRALSFLPSLEISAGQVPGIRNGVRVPGATPGAVCLLHRGELVAVYEPGDDGRSLRPVVIF
jgi:tRNA pseudouridine55 synthase